MSKDKNRQSVPTPAPVVPAAPVAVEYIVTRSVILDGTPVIAGTVLEVSKHSPTLVASLVKRGVLRGREFVAEIKKIEEPKQEIAPVKDNPGSPAILWGYVPAQLEAYTLEQLNTIIVDNMEKAGLVEEYKQNQLLYLFDSKEAAITFMSQDYKA